MKLEINDDVLNGLIVSALSESIESLESDLDKLKKIKNRKQYQEHDLSDALIYIDALKRTRYYFGGIEYKI